MKIVRATQKQFGSTGASGDFGQFGSLAAGAPNYTKDPATIQSLAAFLTGWAAETIATNRPALEDFNGLDYLIFYQICYLFQAGIPEWDSGTTYYLNSFCQVSGTVYKSLANDNLNYNPTTEPTKWELAIHTDESIMAKVYPVGCIYTTTVATDPATLFGFGTWKAFGAGRVLVGKAAAGTFATAGGTGGAETHTLITAEIPAHTHPVSVQYTDGSNRTRPKTNVAAGESDVVTSSSTGGGGAHNNLQPYIVVYLWNRTA